MIKLEDLSPAPGSRKKRRRVGRGPGSGRGKTAGRGTKGQKARSSPDLAPGFEGGRTSLIRRTPKRGFSGPPWRKKEIDWINLERLNELPDNTEVTLELLKEKGWVKKNIQILRVLGEGELKKPLIIKAHHFSENARKKIESAGGKVELC